MESPLVSVITVCRNALPQLRLTMESVALQDYFNLEYIIVDGASTDGTTDFLRQEEQSGIRWISEPDHGIYDAMNKGVAMAKGEWVILMNAGDVFASSDVLSRIFSQQIDAADVIYGDVLKRGSDGKIQVKQAEEPHNARRMFFCHQSSLTRTRLLRETPFDTRHRMSADFKFFKLMLQQGKVFRQVHFPIAFFDTSGVSNTKRSVGLRDNISVINEVDPLTERLRLLPSLMFTYFVCRLRRK